ncbi:MAG: sigma-70 family RNA polymerase sigma factor [Caulobacterales bacterium]|nr:sigma-70 family RNA polymerase sigma factor [Caulobacterales bacterium]
MTNRPASASLALEQLSARLRPKLLRYAARMTGSVFDGEDVVQDALMRIHAAAMPPDAITHPDAWAFRVTHNSAVDFLRRRGRAPSQPDLEVLMAHDPVDDVAQRQAAAAGLRTFMGLTTIERSSVILMDVLGYSLREVVEITGMTLAAIKAALHRGRGRLRDLIQRQDEDEPRPLTPQQEAQLRAYVAAFNGRDFDAVRAMLAEDVRLDLVGRRSASGKAEVSGYFGRYASRADWRLSLSLVDGRPAITIVDPQTPPHPITHFVLVEFEGDRVRLIRDYRYARHVVDEADVRTWDPPGPDGAQS